MRHELSGELRQKLTGYGMQRSVDRYVSDFQGGRLHSVCSL